MRPVLLFDTATDHLALALADLDAPGLVLAAVDFAAPRAANTVVLLAAERLLAGAGLAVAQLRAVACGRGPGSFTGVRIGVATAKGLAHGLGVPLVGFGTPEAIVQRASVEGLVGVVGDAMRGEVYPALFRVSGGVVHRLDDDRVATPATVAAEWAALREPLVLTGPGLGKHRAVFEGALGPAASLASESRWVPDGASLVAAAWATATRPDLRAIAADESSAVRDAAPAVLLPVYTRLSDAEEAERARTGGGPSVVDPRGVAGPGGAPS